MDKVEFKLEESGKHLIELVLKSCTEYPEGPSSDYIGNQPIKKKREIKNVARDMISALTICNNVTPVMQEPRVRESIS